MVKELMELLLILRTFKIKKLNNLFLIQKLEIGMNQAGIEKIRNLED